MSQILFINKVLLCGTVRTDPQLQLLSNNTELCYFSLSFPERWVSNDGQPMERMNWVKVEVLGKPGVEAHKKLTKGKEIFIDGYLRYEKYTKDLKERSIAKLRVFNLMPIPSDGENQLMINKVLISGVVGTSPQMQKLSNCTNLSYFSLSVPEQWVSKDGHPMERNNWFKVESLGSGAGEVFNTLKKGQECFIDGYLRNEKYTKNGEERTILKIRTYSVNSIPWVGDIHGIQSARED